MKVLVLGATGLLGNVMFRFFLGSPGYTVFGTIRAKTSCNLFSTDLHKYLICGVNVEDVDSLGVLFERVKPDVVINCIGLVKQLIESNDPLIAIPINSLLPHRLAKLSANAGARFVHFSTDCVFSGSTGMYVESDFPDATDLYGRTKLLGEVDYDNSITLRTSIIGEELSSSRSLVSWFLSQRDNVIGYKNAIFSGLPTVELARIVRDYVLPDTELRGVYHVSADPISKYDLLSLISISYNKFNDIQIDTEYRINRSLNSSRFRSKTGFVPKTWPVLIDLMKKFG